MKKLLFFALLLSFSSSLWAQLSSPFVNAEINFEVSQYIINVNADGDDWFWDGPDDIVMQTDFYTSSFSNSYGNHCIYQSQDVPFTYELTNSSYYAATGVPFSETMAMHLIAYETDADNGEICTYHDYDDIPVDIWATFHDNGQIANSLYHPGLNDGEWDYSCSVDGVQSGFYIFYPNDWNAPYNMWIRKIWRYAAGDNINNPLNFGDLTLGQTVSYTGVNKWGPQGIWPLSGYPLGWTNTGGQASPDVFESFTLTQAAEVTISTDNDARTFDTVLDLYDASNNLITSNDDGGVLGDLHGSVIKISLAPGTYKFRLEGYENETGTFRVEISTKVPNDEPCNAIMLPANGVAQNGYTNRNTTAAAGEEAIAPTPGDCTATWCESESAPHIAHSVWFRFVAPASGNVEVSTCSLASFDTQIAVYSTSDCGNFNNYTLLKANDDGGGCSLYSSLLTVHGLAPGQTYYVLVDGFNGDVGDIGIKITPLAASAVTELATSLIMTASPNPTEGLLTIRMTDTYQLDAYTICDLSGRMLQSAQLDQPTHETAVDLSTFPKGIYMLKARVGEQFFSQKIVVQ